MTPAASPTAAVSARDGAGRQAKSRHSNNTEPRITPPITSRTGLARNAVSTRDTDRYAKHQPRAQSAHRAPVAQPPGVPQSANADDHLEHHDEWHHLGRRQRQAEQRHRGEAEAVTGEAAQQCGGEYAEHGDEQGPEHRGRTLRRRGGTCPVIGKPWHDRLRHGSGRSRTGGDGSIRGSGAGFSRLGHAGGTA